MQFYANRFGVYTRQIMLMRSEILTTRSTGGSGKL